MKVSSHEEGGRNINCFPLNNYICLYLLGEESVVYSRVSKQLYGLDKTATVILFRLEQGETPAEIISDLNISVKDSTIVMELASLLSGHEEKAGEYNDDLFCSVDPPYKVSGPHLFRLFDTCIAFEGPEEVLTDWIFPFFEPLRSNQILTADLVVKFVEHTHGTYQLFMNNDAQGSPVSVNGLIPMLYSHVRTFAFQKQQRLLTLHASVLHGNKGKTLILAGCSGSGKSTLTATLLTRGFDLVSDEPAVVDSKDCKLLAMPLGLGLKEGSWRILSSNYPELGQFPSHVRFDGQKIHYLLPGPIRVVPNCTVYSATHLVFPSYSPESSGQIEHLSIVQALNRFAETGYQVPGLDEKRAESIILWLSGIKCYSLVYPSSEDALRLLKGIIF